MSDDDHPPLVIASRRPGGGGWRLLHEAVASACKPKNMLISLRVGWRNIIIMRVFLIFAIIVSFMFFYCVFSLLGVCYDVSPF